MTVSPSVIAVLDEASSVVYSTLRRAVELDGVDISLPLDRIPAEIMHATAPVRQNR